MRVSVTGATGFVGSHLVEALLARRDDVTALVRNPDKAARLFPTQAIRWIRGDLDDGAALRAAVAGADIVFHVAGLTVGTRRELLAANRDGTRTVIAATADAAPAVARFVYVSSQAAAGPSRRDRARRDDDPPEPVSDYGRSKLAGEEETARAPFPWTVIRPPSVYGPRDAEFLRVFVMARRGLLPRIGDGGQPISLIHVSDLVAALVAVSSAPCVAHVHFATHPQTTSTLDLALAIHRAVHRTLGDAETPARRPRVLPVPTVAARAAMTVIGALARLTGRRTLVNADKARELAQAAWTCCAEPLEEHTGWRARVPLDDGLTDTARWYRTHGRL